MTQERYEHLTPEQRDRLLEVYGRRELRDVEGVLIRWEDFRDSAYLAIEGCVMVMWLGMWLGIEKDGYCHS